MRAGHQRSSTETKSVAVNAAASRVRGFVLNAGKMAHPTRFERVTFAFGGRVFLFATNCGGLRTCKKPPLYSHFLMDAFAPLC
jgi:hypothetical protein